MTLDVPAKPTDMAAFWPVSGRKEVTTKDGVSIQYRDITVGPFPNRTEASWYDGQVQDVIMGWNRKELFAGRIFPFGDVWYIERWETNDGPFTSLAVAYDRREEIYAEYRQALDQYWENSGGYPADIRRQKQWSKVPAEATNMRNTELHFNGIEPDTYVAPPKISESGKVQVTPAGKVRILAKSSDDVWKEPEHAPKGGSGISKPKKTTDDIIDVSVESSIRAFIEGVEANIVASGSWVGPSAEVLAEWEQNRQALEGSSLEDDDEDIIPDDKPLTHGDVPVIMGILMDRLGITRFEFSTEEMLAFKGLVILDQPEAGKSSYIMVRQDK